MRIAKIKWAMPHCYALIFFIIILVALLTWCIPSGSFGLSLSDLTRR